MNDVPDPVKEAADRVVSYAMSCRMKNTLEWMEGLAAHLNKYLHETNQEERVATHGYGFQTLTTEELSTLDKYGYPNQ